MAEMSWVNLALGGGGGMEGFTGEEGEFKAYLKLSDGTFLVLVEGV